MNLINRIRTLRFRYVPLTLIPIVITIGMGLLERYVEFRDENDDLLLLIAALLFVCICADGLRIAVSYIPIPGGTFAKRAILVVGVLVIVGLTVSTVHEMRGPTMFYTESYQCENDTSFTATFSSDERVHIVEDGGVIRDLSLSSDVMENYNDGIVGYTFLHNQAIVTQMGDEPRSTFCTILDTLH